jgi:hypothetical protein
MTLALNWKQATKYVCTCKMISELWHHVDLRGYTNVSEEHNVSIFMAEVGIYL